MNSGSTLQAAVLRDPLTTTDSVLQRRFASALLDPAAAVPFQIANWQGKAAIHRFNVHRNNVVVSLINALVNIYPAVERITGRDFFRAMARFHVRETPPKSPLLFDYGRDFPTFIERYRYAQEMPWLGDVARIERAWLDAYYAADARPLNTEALSAVPMVSVEGLRFLVHPATRIVRSRYSAASIFTANRSEGPFASIDASRPEDTLITRPNMSVEVRHLPPGGAVFLASLVSGSTLSAAASAAFEASPAFALAANVAGFLEAGVFSDIDAGN